LPTFLKPSPGEAANASPGPAPLWVGIDLGRYRSSLCILDGQGQVLLQDSCETDVEQMEALIAPFSRDAIQRVALEAGAISHIARKLLARGYPVSVFETRKASKFLTLRRSKSDTGDARGLADLARLGLHTVSQVHLSSPECQRLRSRLKLRGRLVRLRVSMEGAVHARLAFEGCRVRRKQGSARLRDKVGQLLTDLDPAHRQDLELQLEPFIDLSERARAHLAKIDNELASYARKHPVCSHLMQIFGVGPICATAFFSAVEDPARFARVSDVGAYLGLVPRRRQTGESARMLGITKTGSKLARMHLVNSATVLMNRGPDCALKSWSLELRQRCGRQRARVALARKLAVVLLSMWKSGAPFEQHRSRSADPAALS
jgi:transposase